ncbi:MAG: PhnD/SsuA/transferrin family substrate-binding protein [Alphaproteobacteria bacterium]|nr:PhnD/SsuA/transferrin family substrate-binding protein [Alphaproteobacteria bacterium]
MDTKLDMYNAPIMRPLFARLTDHALAGVDHAALGAGDLALGQICGIDYVRAPAGHYHYLATFSVADTSFPAGHYNSLLVATKGAGFDLMRDYDAATTPVAINQAGSFSGALALKANLMDAGLDLPEAVKFSGGHLASMEMVAEGQAALAAIDRLSFAMARAQSPDMVAGVDVVGETAMVPGLPFICSPKLPAEARAQVTANLLSLPEAAFWPELAAALALRGVDAINPAAYDAIRAVDARV